MKPKKIKVAVAATTATALAKEASAAPQALDEIIEAIKGKSDEARTEAWQRAATLGAPAVKPLASLATNPDLEVARAAKRGLWKMVHTFGRPGTDSEKQAVVQELIPLLKSSPALRREVLWMLSEIGGDEAVEPVTAMLSDKDFREDARAALQRIPGQKSLEALKSALATAPAEFQAALAESLRDRGVRLDQYPSRKLTPSKQTSVKPG